MWSEILFHEIEAINENSLNFISDPTTYDFLRYRNN